MHAYPASSESNARSPLMVPASMVILEKVVYKAGRLERTNGGNWNVPVQLRRKGTGVEEENLRSNRQVAVIHRHLSLELTRNTGNQPW